MKEQSFIPSQIARADPNQIEVQGSNMTIPDPTFQGSETPQTWQSLKYAIAASSGFQRWRRERLATEPQGEDVNLEHQVRRYLRETLETLAY